MAVSSEIKKSALTDIVNILVDRHSPRRIWLFGSRATGNNKDYSDYDIAIEGRNIPFRMLRITEEKIDEVLGIYSCDLVELGKVSSKFSELVKERGKIIYERG